MAILKIRDENGKVQEILALKGEKGEKGDKGDTPLVDQQFDSTSENAQSGKAVYGAYQLLDSKKSDTDHSHSAMQISVADWTPIEPMVGTSVQGALDYINQTIGEFETALDGIIAIQDSLMGGETA